MQVQARHACLQCWIEGSSAARRNLANLATGRALAGPSRSITSSSTSLAAADADVSSTPLVHAPEEIAPATDRTRFQRFPEPAAHRGSRSSQNASNNAKGKGKGKASLTELLLAARRPPAATSSSVPDAPAGKKGDGKPAGKRLLTRKAKAKARAAEKRKQGTDEDHGRMAPGIADAYASTAGPVDAAKGASAKPKSIRARRKPSPRGPNSHKNVVERAGLPTTRKLAKKAEPAPSSSLGGDSKSYECR